MAKGRPTVEFATAYPHIDQWVYEEGGWIEIGADEYSASFVRVLNQGGMVWEGEQDYPSLDAALCAADAGIAEWLEEEGMVPATKATTSQRKPAAKKSATPKLVPVESSMLTAIGYDSANKELIAVFRSGATWRYRGVPKKVYQQLLASGLKGGYMRDLIIGQYPEYQVRR